MKEETTTQKVVELQTEIAELQKKVRLMELKSNGIN